MKNILVTGCAGFVGFHVASRLLERGSQVTGLDNMNAFYDEGLKAARLAFLQGQPLFQFHEGDISDRRFVAGITKSNEFDFIIHLAAQAGVRYSLENPFLYVQSNIVGFLNLLEEARSQKSLRHFLFASSSSVYGENRKVPFAESDNVDHPISLYAATKKSNELMAHVYSHLYNIRLTGLRFFTVYGPWGRPDMAIFKFCKAIHEGTPIELYNHGNMERDFTYIDDIVEAILRLLEMPDSPGQHAGASPFYRLFNIGNNQPVKLARLVEVLEEKIGRKAELRLLPMQPGDVPATYADIDALSAAVGFVPKTSIEDGIGRFVDWYRQFYGLRGTASR